MEGWRAVGGVAQLKWTLVARGAAVLDESALAATVLDLLITCARYYPSRYLYVVAVTSGQNIPLVQMLMGTYSYST